MLMKFATALLFKKSKQCAMPLFVVVFSVFLLFQQFAAFRSIRGEIDAFCRELEDVDLWVKSSPLGVEDLLKVRRLPEVALASFLYKGTTEAYAPSGQKKGCMLLGVDESTHLGLPTKVLYGSLRLKGGEDTAILSAECAKCLFKLGSQKLRPSSALFLSDRQLKIGGVVPEKRGFIVYTNLAKAKEISSAGQTLMLIKASPLANISALKTKIEKVSGLKAFTPSEFSKELFQNYMHENRTVSLFSVVVIFALVLALGIFVAIFYHYFKGQLENYSVLKAVGATPVFISLLLTLQATIISLLGWSTSFFLYTILQKIFSGSELFFPLSWGIIGMTLCSLLAVSLGTALFVSFKVKEVV